MKITICLQINSELPSNDERKDNSYFRKCETLKALEELLGEKETKLVITEEAGCFISKEVSSYKQSESNTLKKISPAEICNLNGTVKIELFVVCTVVSSY